MRQPRAGAQALLTPWRTGDTPGPPFPRGGGGGGGGCGGGGGGGAAAGGGG
ncbi:hypothetical protein I5J60_28995, partial [Pseudomonas aeruginosa]|nr:hypothetical protein [Pseudomonas aeruginosa]